MNMMRSWGGLSPYEDYKIADMVSRKSNGGTVTALVLGSVGLAAALGAWVFGPMVSNSRANGVRDLANARYDATNAQIATLASLLGTERAERVAQGVTMTQSITDSISGSQSGSQSQSQTTAIDNTIQQVMQQTFADAITGRSSLNPTPVSLYSPAKEFQCGCGCNG